MAERFHQRLADRNTIYHVFVYPGVVSKAGIIDSISETVRAASIRIR